MKRNLILWLILFCLLFGFNAKAETSMLDEAYSDIADSALLMSDELLDLVLVQADLLNDAVTEAYELAENGQSTIEYSLKAVDKVKLAEELRQVRTVGDFIRVIGTHFQDDVGSLILEQIFGTGALAAVEGVYRLINLDVALYKGINAVSVNSSSKLLQEAEIVYNNIHEAYGLVEEVAIKNIAEYGFDNLPDITKQLDYMSKVYYDDADAVYKKIKKELKNNWFNLFRNARIKVELEHMTGYLKPYLDTKPSYSAYYNSYISGIKRNPPELIADSLLCKYDENLSVISVDVSAQSTIPWLEYTFSISESGEVVCSRKQINNDHFEYTTNNPGTYTIRVTIKDRLNQTKKLDDKVEIKVSDIPIQNSPRTTPIPIFTIKDGNFLDMAYWNNQYAKDVSAHSASISALFNYPVQEMLSQVGCFIGTDISTIANATIENTSGTYIILENAQDNLAFNTGNAKQLLVFYTTQGEPNTGFGITLMPETEYYYKFFAVMESGEIIYDNKECSFRTRLSDATPEPIEATVSPTPAPILTPSPLDSFAFDKMKMLSGKVSAYYIGDKAGIILRDGTIITEPVYSSIDLCMCDQGKRFYGFSETISAIRDDTNVIISPETGLEVGSHGGHGGATGISTWNVNTQTYTNPNGYHVYEGGISIAFDEESESGRQTYTLLNHQGCPLITGAEFISIPTDGRSTVYSYSDDPYAFCIAVKDNTCWLLSGQGGVISLGQNARHYYDGIAPIQLGEDAWTYISGQVLLTDSVYEDATTVCNKDGEYYAWVKENGSWHTIVINPNKSAEPEDAEVMYIDSHDWSHAIWPDIIYELSETGEITVSDKKRNGPPKTYSLFRFYYSWDSERNGYQILHVEKLPEDTSRDSFLLDFPISIDGYDVVSIADDCCRDLEEIYRIHWPDHLQYIGNYAFYNCSGLYEALLPATVQYIGDWSFAHCDLWDGVSFSKTAEIGVGAFADTANSTPDGIITLKGERSEDRSWVEYKDHCLHAIFDEGSPESETYIKQRDEARKKTESSSILPTHTSSSQTPIPASSSISAISKTGVLTKELENTDVQTGKAGYRDGTVEVKVTKNTSTIHAEISQSSLDNMLPEVREDALRAIDEINSAGHADGSPKQDNAQVCAAVYRAVKLALKKF